MATRICYLCGAPGADTDDHVVSKTFYIPPRPSDLLTLPAHLACNQSTAKDEEWVSIAWSTCRPLPDDGDARYEKAKRSLLRDEAGGLRQALLDSMTPHPSGGAMLDLGDGRVDYVLAKIVKGLVFKFDGLLTSAEHTWLIRKIDLALMVEQQFPNQVEVHDVAVFRWGTMGATVFWALAFFNMHIFSGIAVAAVDLDRLANRVPGLRSGLRLPWPKGLTEAPVATVLT